MRKLLVFMFSVIMLMGCGGSDSGGGGGNGGNGGGNGGGGDTQPQGDVTVSGTVVHSVYSAADIVCYDRNSNKKCDTGEPSARIASNGAYTLIGTEADAVAVPVVAELTNSGSGISSFAAGSNTRLVLEAPAGQRIISSLSMIVKAKMDNDPSLSFDDAHAAVQSDLGTSADLFSVSSAVAALAAEITAVITAMFDDLATRFGIIISDKVIILVISEIIPQLTDIAGGKTPDEVVVDTIGGMSETDVEDKMDDLAESMPKVMSIDEVMSQKMKMYQFHENGSSWADYAFSLFVFSDTGFKFGEITNFLLPLPTVLNRLDADLKATRHSDGSISFSDGNREMRMINVDVVPLDGKSLTPNPAHPQRTIVFSAGALMYKLNNYYFPTIPSVEQIQNDLSSGKSNLPYSRTDAKNHGNYIETVRHNGSEKFRIDLNSDGTFVTTPQTAGAVYDWHDAFGPRNTMPKGTYEKTKDSKGDDLYTFYVDGRKAFLMLNVADRGNSFGTTDYIAGRYSSAGLEPKNVFNKIAAEDIQSQW